MFWYDLKREINIIITPNRKAADKNQIIKQDKFKNRIIFHIISGIRVLYWF